MYLSSEYVSIVCKNIRSNSIYNFYKKYDKHIDNYLKFINELKNIFNLKILQMLLLQIQKINN